MAPHAVQCMARSSLPARRCHSRIARLMPRSSACHADIWYGLGVQLCGRIIDVTVLHDLYFDGTPALTRNLQRQEATEQRAKRLLVLFRHEHQIVLATDLLEGVEDCFLQLARELVGLPMLP